MLNRDRLQQAQARMRERGIDAYLILTHDDYIYFFGEDRFQPRAVIPAAGPPIVVTFQGEEAEVRESIGVDDVKIFGTVGQQIKDVVGTMRGMAGRQGVHDRRRSDVVQHALPSCSTCFNAPTPRSRSSTSPPSWTNCDW